MSPGEGFAPSSRGDAASKIFPQEGQLSCPIRIESLTVSGIENCWSSSFRKICSDSLYECTVFRDVHILFSVGVFSEKERELLLKISSYPVF